MFEFFTDRARRALVEAQTESAENRHGFLGTEHILIGLVRVGEGMAYEVLTRRGVELEPLREKVGARLGEFVDPKRHEVTQEAVLASIGIDLGSVRSRLEDAFGPGALPDPTATPPFTANAKESLERALRRALTLRHRYIGTEHELLGILDLGDGLACSALLDLGVDLEALDADVVALAAPDEARASAAWRESFELQIKVQALDEPQRTAANDALAALIGRRGRALQAEQEAVRTAAIDSAERIEQAIADTRRALADRGIEL